MNHALDELESKVIETATVFFCNTDHEPEAVEIFWLSGSGPVIEIWEDLIKEVLEEDAMRHMCFKFGLSVLIIALHHLIVQEVHLHVIGDDMLSFFLCRDIIHAFIDQIAGPFSSVVEELAY